MYLDLFKLRELPFRLSPDPEFLYLSKNHARAKAYMESTIWFTDGFVVITGEIGSGKTTLIETFLKELDQDVVVAQINQTQVSALEFLQTLLVQFGFQPFKMKKAEILATLNQFLIEQYASNRKVLVIVDEAQNLSPKVLEEVRMLSGVETTKDKVLRIILAGQPELNQKLDAPELVQLVQRVRLRFHLSALTREDMEGYVRHRLEVAGAEGREIFQPDTFDKIYRYTGGTPRLINTLCDTAMMAAFSADRDVVTLEDVDAAIAELQWVEFSQRPNSAALHLREGVEETEDEDAGPRRVVAGAAPAPRKAAPTVGRIVVSTETGDVAEVPLKVGRMVIGRTADNDLQIDSRFVSRHHCQVVSTADLSVIEDLNSTNGIFLNQKKIRRHVLIDGDIIELGTHRLRYVEERTGGAGSGGIDTLPGAQETALLE
ncbi:MAG: AAA family ATPase [Steroidobacteraceae bacterium]|jgi:type II secretory pathway predicted ATPase ExeA|nr:AAA family ATPase [Steroidobacteraceae bacterium]